MKKNLIKRMLAMLLFGSISHATTHRITSEMCEVVSYDLETLYSSLKAKDEKWSKEEKNRIISEGEKYSKKCEIFYGIEESLTKVKKELSSNDDSPSSQK